MATIGKGLLSAFSFYAGHRFAQPGLVVRGAHRRAIRAVPMDMKPRYAGTASGFMNFRGRGRRRDLLRRVVGILMGPGAGMLPSSPRRWCCRSAPFSPPLRIWNAHPSTCRLERASTCSLGAAAIREGFEAMQ
jgi:hypothetical protein